MTDPLHYHSAPGREPARWPHEVGASILNIDLKPQQRVLGRMLDLRSETNPNAPANFDPVAEMSRRTGKTTTIFATLVGRCALAPKTTATFCAQSGKKSRERFADLHKLLKDSGRGGWRVKEAIGNESVTFNNGSRIRFLPPIASNFRGDADDTVVFDEAQELREEKGEDLLGAVLPLFDTRPAGQLILAGTAGEARGGLFWDALEQGRAGLRGIVEYGAEDDIDYIESLFHKGQETLPHEALQVLLASHPGIGNLTTLETIVRNWKKMGQDQFLREYLGVWPAAMTLSGLTTEHWKALEGAWATPDAGSLVFGYDVAPDRSASAVVAAWRSDGRKFFEIVDMRLGYEWVADVVCELFKTYRRPFFYDALGGSLDIAAKIALRNPKPELHGLSTAQYASAYASFVAEAVNGSLGHFGQPDFANAVDGAGRRRIGDGLYGWGRRASSAPISPLIAATVASFGLEGTPVRTRRRIRSAALAGMR